MTEVVIKNKKLLKQLDQFTDIFFSIDGYDDKKYWVRDPADAVTNGELYCSDEYFHKQKALGDAHTGFPEQHFSQPVGRMAVEDPDKWRGIRDLVRMRFAETLGVHSAALFNYYPKGGHVGWHTNWNAPAYQILFTWSRTGDGYFRYHDPVKDEIVTIQDTKGWACRHYYFGAKAEPEHHCWHAAYAGCDRITLAYKFHGGPDGMTSGKGTKKDDLAQDLRDDLIYEIEEES